jgi:hypothetical protein
LLVSVLLSVSFHSLDICCGRPVQWARALFGHSVIVVD